MDFEKILNWELQTGSHPFPGPKGGTCILEAAIVAAGFPYQRIGGDGSIPISFSRVISAFLLGLNDAAPNTERQQLKRFLLKFHGSADSPEVERHRDNIIRHRIQSEIIPLCAFTNELEVISSGSNPSEIVRYVAFVARKPEAWKITLSIVEEAFSIGNQADPLDADIAAARLEGAKSDKSETPPQRPEYVAAMMNAQNQLAAMQINTWGNIANLKQPQWQT